MSRAKPPLSVKVIKNNLCKPREELALIYDLVKTIGNDQ